MRGGSSERVGAAWAIGSTASSTNVHTDGSGVWSYSRHTIGWKDGERRIAICCHASTSTAAQCSAIAPFAHEIRECEKHARPDLHKNFAPGAQHVSIPIDLERCPTDWFRRPTEALRAFPRAQCAFLCLFGEHWHPNLSWAHDSRESAREHDTDLVIDASTSHRLSPTSPSQDELYQAKGFRDKDECHELTRGLLGDDLQHYREYRLWQLTDQSRQGLLERFPHVLIPQPAERLWWVTERRKSTWHRAMETTAVSFDSARPALCGQLPSDRSRYWGRRRVEPPREGARVCEPCAHAAGQS